MEVKYRKRWVNSNGNYEGIHIHSILHMYVYIDMFIGVYICIVYVYLSFLYNLYVPYIWSNNRKNKRWVNSNGN
jgi:hypothetical protein